MASTKRSHMHGSIRRVFTAAAVTAAILVGQHQTFCASAGAEDSIPDSALPGTEVPGTIEFNRDVRPILSDKCFSCHGPDRNQRKGELRLDTQAGILGTAEKPGPLIPGSPESSELFRRIVSQVPEEQMPPGDSGRILSEHEVAVLKKWIEQGGVYEGHWAFLPINSVNSNAQRQSAAQPREISDRIDQFVSQTLAEHRLTPSAAADRVTLLRRLSFDLIGLPPSEQEVHDFVHDQSPDSVEKVVDRLLASPHYGERMAMWWLDLVRYADTVGYHGDQEMSVSPFRQYVIESFNNNKPFDQFTVEQLAGDLLPEASREHLIASGYNRLGMMSAEGGVQDKEYLAKYIAERVRNASGTWLGVTLGCAECHDHKFDPFTTRDFYRFEAFFADIREKGLYVGSNSSGLWGPSMKVPSPEQEAALGKLDREIAETRLVLEKETPEIAAERSGWLAAQPVWHVLKPDSMKSEAGATLSLTEDSSILVSDKSAPQDVYTLTVTDLPAGVTAFRLEVLPHDSLPKKGPGRAENGNFVLTEFAAERSDGLSTTEPAPTVASSLPVPFQNASATYEQAAGPENPWGKWSVESAVDGDLKGKTWGWAVLENTGKSSVAVFETTQDLTLSADDASPIHPEPAAGNQSPRNELLQNDEPDVEGKSVEGSGVEGPADEKSESDKPAADSSGSKLLTISLIQHHDNPQHTIGRFRIAVTTSPRPVRASEALPAVIENFLATPADQRSDAQKSEFEIWYRTISPLLAPVRQQLAALETSRSELDAVIPATLITETVTPRMVRVLPRGNWMDESGEEVTPAFPEFLNFSSASETSPGESAVQRLTRLDLARWITAPQNPLTARVVVNRLWKIYFGAGLSRKLDDLGAQGEWPSHPLLLDALAGDLIAGGWNLKLLIKAIVMSRTYQQTSVGSPVLAEADPYNRWLARQGRFRLDAELVRDNALSVSGLLVHRIGGKSVHPYQPAGYWAYLNFPMREWKNDQGEDLYRRGLYTHWQRQYLHPGLLAFDAPSREECTADRARSNTPLQSLVLLNDPEYVEAARAFAELILRHPESTTQGRLSFAFRRAVSRDIRPDEQNILEQLLISHRAEYQADPSAAADILKTGDRPVPADLDSIEMAAWTSVARTILNLHETITRN